MQNQNESINSIVWSCSSKEKVSGIHCFTISICETVSQFNDNLMTQFDEIKRNQRIRTIKSSESENRGSNVKKCCNH